MFYFSWMLIYRVISLERCVLLFYICVPRCSKVYYIFWKSVIFLFHWLRSKERSWLFLTFWIEIVEGFLCYNRSLLTTVEFRRSKWTLILLCRAILCSLSLSSIVCQHLVELFDLYLQLLTLCFNVLLPCYSPIE